MSERAGVITQVASGGVALLAFLALPVLGTVAAAELAGYASQFGPFGVLWVVLIANLALLGVALWQLLDPSREGPARRHRPTTVVVLAHSSSCST